MVDGSLYCNFCDCDVSWIHKSDVHKHIQTAKHVKGKSIKRPADTSSDSSHSVSAPLTKRQRSMGEMVSAAAKKTHYDNGFDHHFCSCRYTTAES